MVVITIPRSLVTQLAEDRFNSNVRDAELWIKQQIEKYIALGVFYYLDGWDDPFPTYLTETPNEGDIS